METFQVNKNFNQSLLLRANELLKYLFTVNILTFYHSYKSMAIIKIMPILCALFSISSLLHQTGTKSHFNICLSALKQHDFSKLTGAE